MKPQKKLALIVFEVLSFRSRCKVEKYLLLFSQLLEDQPVLMETNNRLKINRINKHPVSVLSTWAHEPFNSILKLSQLVLQTIQINLIQFWSRRWQADFPNLSWLSQSQLNSIGTKTYHDNELIFPIWQSAAKKTEPDRFLAILFCLTFVTPWRLKYFFRIKILLFYCHTL